ncbi:MAG TPA: DUF433 domain-containing protein [Pyrinomonadaceae bacterium]|nr:DUF433 domain-containing protein [Pyrinomonadaceae bacterium]
MNFTDTPLLTKWPNGAMRLTGSRVALEIIVGRIKKGLTAEEINDCFPSVSVEHISGVMAWYQDNKAATEEYIRAIDAEWEILRKELESDPQHIAFREKLRQRKEQMIAQGLLAPQSE